MIEINLVPDVKQELIKAQRSRNNVITLTILIGIISLALVVALAFYVFGVQAIRDNLLDSSINKNISELKKVDDLSKTLTVQNQLTKLSDLNKSKRITSRVFDLLNSVIPPAPNDVLISSFSLNTDDGVIRVEGQAVNSYSAVEIFKKTLEGAKLRYKAKGVNKEVDLVSSVSISETSYGQDATGNRVLRFIMSFVYDPKLLAQESKETSIAIVINGNVTDSYVGIPKSIFADRPVDIEEDK